jgi:hypothetical protein
VRALKPKSYDVFVSPASDRKLAAHIEFLSRVSEPAAERLYLAYNKALLFLESSPKSCAAYIPLKPIEAELRFNLMHHDRSFNTL